MLVLSRKKGQSIMIGNDIEISIVDIQGDQIRIGINAPRSVGIHRKEVFEEIRQENTEARAVQLNAADLKKAMELLQEKKSAGEGPDAHATAAEPASDAGSGKSEA